jgi:hypothetical protein
VNRITLSVLLSVSFVAANVFISRPRPDSRKRTLVVEVREAGTDCRLSGALVRVGGITRTILTDSLGRVLFPAKATLSQKVTASFVGYRDTADTPWLVASDTVIACLDLVPARSRTVIGEVVNGNGRPLSATKVWIASDTTVTDSTGRFVLRWSHARPLELQAVHMGLPCCIRNVRLVGLDTVAVNATLYDSTTRGDIVGRVFDGWTGEVAVGACIVIDGTELGIPTDINGDYAFRGLKPGDYVVVCPEERMSRS